MSRVRLDTIRECFEGVIPAIIGTADADGMPNVSYLTQVQYIDPQHIALSYQFFNKTRANILGSRQARLMVISPLTAAQYLLTLEFLRTETSGSLFESMKAKLSGIASQVGMSGVFQLLGSDVYRVTDMVCLQGAQLPAPPPPLNRLAELRNSAERLRECRELDRLFDETLNCLNEKFGIAHAMLLMHEAPARLYTVASRGYAESGVGSEIALGEGVIGVAARERTPIRISHMTSEYGYSRAIRSQTADAQALEIPLPGLAESRSQMAVPILGCSRLMGILYVESPQDLRFTYDDEDALVTLCAQLAMQMHILQEAEPETAQQPPVPAPAPEGAPLLVRHFTGNDSVFFGDDYLIKGVAGAVLWRLVQDYVQQGRSSFSNRELRLDARLRLPDVNDNLEARLVLLARRLAERGAGIAIEKTGRGHFRLDVQRPLQLQEVA
ncbi:GAF domain-containing protein [Massilia endophytica]|uniref:GAF domain-containing protein n=1 Tax=Massilia endophytica TaxID=2899220 RepID=UPI001E28E13B|nr:pyridoxamine 5'-phosphate oxidase family protein [Massilia endophytica]UGQ46927.1 GAF domain-containing protein [Massilia endophytica]